MHFLLQKTSNERPLKLKIAHLEQKLFVAQNEAKIIKREMDQLRTEKSLQLKEQVRLFLFYFGLVADWIAVQQAFKLWRRVYNYKTTILKCIVDSSPSSPIIQKFLKLTCFTNFISIYSAKLLNA